MTRPPAEDSVRLRVAVLVTVMASATAVLRVGARPSRLAGLLGELSTELGAGRVTAGLATGIGTVTLPARATRLRSLRIRSTIIRFSARCLGLFWFRPWRRQALRVVMPDRSW